MGSDTCVARDGPIVNGAGKDSTASLTALDDLAEESLRRMQDPLREIERAQELMRQFDSLRPVIEAMRQKDLFREVSEGLKFSAPALEAAKNLTRMRELITLAGFDLVSQ